VCCSHRLVEDACRRVLVWLFPSKRQFALARMLRMDFSGPSFVLLSLAFLYRCHPPFWSHCLLKAYLCVCGVHTLGLVSNVRCLCDWWWDEFIIRISAGFWLDYESSLPPTFQLFGSVFLLHINYIQPHTYTSWEFIELEMTGGKDEEGLCRVT